MAGDLPLQFGRISPVDPLQRQSKRRRVNVAETLANSSRNYTLLAHRILRQSSLSNFMT